VDCTLEAKPGDIIFPGGCTVFIPSSKTPTHMKITTNFTASQLQLQSANPNKNSTIGKSASNTPISEIIWLSLSLSLFAAFHLPQTTHHHQHFRVSDMNFSTTVNPSLM
jgi:hypothetical protein